MGSDRVFPLVPKKVTEIETPNRRIITEIPVPASIPILKKLRKLEPRSMQGQPPIVWDRAEGVHIYDKWGNKWLDFSSGVLVTNAGHGHPDIVKAIIEQVRKPLLHNYCFPSEIRMKCVEAVLDFAPAYLDKLFLLTTGSETTENALKLARTWGHKIGGKKKNIIISFEGAFHGRTLGAQMMGGIPSLKEWIVNHDPDIVQVPFPDGFYNTDTSFDLFEKSVERLGINPDNVCAVISETYQGGGADFMPKKYAEKLRKWCDEHNALLIFDEVQAGFGRTGKDFGFMHYDVKPDLVCLGKGISSGLPISGVLGKSEIMDLYPPGSMTSTHSGNPVACAAVIANIEIIRKEKLVENSERVGKYMHELLDKIVKDFELAGVCHGKGLVAGLQIVKPGTKIPDPDKAFEICKMLYERGIMMFAPVGKCTLKICPPLCINEEQVKEGIDVIREVLEKLR